MRSNLAPTIVNIPYLDLIDYHVVAEPDPPPSRRSDVLLRWRRRLAR